LGIIEFLSSRTKLDPCWFPVPEPVFRPSEWACRIRSLLEHRMMLAVPHSILCPRQHVMSQQVVPAERRDRLEQIDLDGNAFLGCRHTHPWYTDDRGCADQRGPKFCSLLDGGKSARVSLPNTAPACWLTPAVGGYSSYNSALPRAVVPSDVPPTMSTSIRQQRRRGEHPCHGHAAGGGECPGAGVVQLRARESHDIVLSTGDEHPPAG